MKKINPKDLNACPHCMGVNGYETKSENGKNRHIGFWGVSCGQSGIAQCRDCGKPFEIAEK